MNRLVDIPHVRIITVSGRIGAGSTTLAKHLAKTLNWKYLEGGEMFWEKIRKQRNLKEEETNLRSNQEDLEFDKHLKKILKKDHHLVLETKLAGFNAQDIFEIFKILIVCEDRNGVDQAEIRIDRLMNREEISVEEAKKEVIEREKNDLEKWRKLYANSDPNWTYYNKKFYDLVINTFDHNKEETLKIALEAIGLNE